MAVAISIIIITLRLRLLRFARNDTHQLSSNKAVVTMNKNLNGLIKFVAAGVIYLGFAVYLFQPHFKNFDKLHYLLVINVCLASLGCYVLSRRWVSVFAGSFFAGAVYGFGPFSLGLTCYHPLASLLAASVPWLFCPAVFWRDQPFTRAWRAPFCKRKAPAFTGVNLSPRGRGWEPGHKARWRWLSWPLSALPFLAILLFFQVSAHYRLFAIPTQTKLQFADLVGLVAPLVSTKRGLALLGFYHIPIAALIMGASMLFAARRFGPMIVFCLGVILALCQPLLNASSISAFGYVFSSVSPIIWLTVPVLCCSVLVGVGMQGLASAGSADRKWILSTAIIMGTFAIVTLLLATKYFQVFAGLAAGYARLFVQTAVMYILGAIAAAIIFFMARAKLRIRTLRWAILASAMAVDIFLGARFIVDRIF